MIKKKYKAETVTSLAEFDTVEEAEQFIEESFQKKLEEKIVRFEEAVNLQPRG